MTAAPAVAVVGEALVDLVPDSTTYDVRPGGSPANTALALARLGVPVAMVARFGADEFGRLLRRHLAGSGVDLSLAVDAAEPSSVALVTKGIDGSADYRFLIDGTADWQWTANELPELPPSVLAIHAGSLALARAVALEPWLARRPDSVILSLDPNLRRGLLPHDAPSLVDRWVRMSDIVKVSVDDLALLHPDEKPLIVAERWAASGPALVVVTAGSDGATAFFGDEVLHGDALHVDVVDTIAAGDAFTAGLLHQLHARDRLGEQFAKTDRADIVAALETATAVAGLTCKRAGADPPFLDDLPWR